MSTSLGGQAEPPGSVQGRPGEWLASLREGPLREHRSKLALGTVILALILFTATQSDVFLTWTNWKNLLSQVAVTGILAAGTTILMVSGGIDLSIGSAVSFTAMVMATLMAHGMSPALAIAAGAAAATLIGTTNGMLAANSKSHPFVITLGMLTLLQGAALLISSTPINEIPLSLLDIGNAEVLGLPLVGVIFLGVALVAHLILSRTKFGRWLYAIGGSESAARLAGVPVAAVKVAAYALMGLLVGLCAFLTIAQLAAADAHVGAGLELAAIAAVAVGGTPLAGGRGDILGTLMGVLLLGLIGNALDLMSISGDWQFVLQGAVIIVAVMAQRDS